MVIVYVYRPIARRGSGFNGNLLDSGTYNINTYKSESSYLNFTHLEPPRANNKAVELPKTSGWLREWYASIFQGRNT